MRNWIDLGSDVNWADYYGRWGRPASKGSRIWYVVEFTNMYDATSERECKQHNVNQYEVQVKRVDLDTLTAEKLKSVLESCGIDLEDVPREKRDTVLVEACVGYGFAAPMWEKTSSNFAKRLLANARCKAEELMKDPEMERKLLDRPVNMIGTSAENYGLGRIFTKDL